ncbi:MAG: tyrosine-type recombinase/integrase [Candidatus Margulisiibacteriota bacterium]
MLFISAVDEFLAHANLVRNLSKATITSYRSDQRLFARFLESQSVSDIAKIDRELIDRYIAQQQVQNPKKPTTIRRRCHSLMSLFKFCVSRKHLPFSPAEELQIPKKEVYLPVVPSEIEQEIFISTPIYYRKNIWRAKRDSAIVLCFCHLGARFSEVKNIKRDDVDLENGTVVLNGKGRKQRLMPLSSRLIIALRDWLAVRPKVKNDNLFVSDNGVSALGKSGLRKVFNRHLKRCGITRKGITPHKFRHAFCVNLLKKENNLMLVKECMGHRDISTTAIYLHVTNADMKNAIQNTFG